MRRLILMLGLSTAVAISAAVVYQADAVDRSYRALLARGDAAARRGETFDAIEAYSGALALRPDSMLAHLRRGEIYRARGELDLAARDLRRAAALDPAATRPLDSLGDVLFARGWFARAAAVFDRRLRLDDSVPAATYNLALARYQAGDVDGALRVLERTPNQTGALAAAHYLLGVCFRDLGQRASAAAAFRKALHADPGLVSAREELADLYRLDGRPADALEQLRLLAALDRDNVERHIALALAQLETGRGELAVVTLGRALRRKPDQVGLLYGALGRVWLAMADHRADAIGRALDALERAAASEASSAVLTLYGRALIAADRLQDAERVLGRAIRRFPVDPDAFLRYADVAEAAGRTRAARGARRDYALLARDATPRRDPLDRPPPHGLALPITAPWDR